MNKVCPYKFFMGKKDNAQIVLLPIHYISNKSIKQNVKINLNNSVVFLLNDIDLT